MIPKYIASYGSWKSPISAEQVLAFLRDKDAHPWQAGSPVFRKSVR
jgi:hypothetical protein